MVYGRNKPGWNGRFARTSRAGSLIASAMTPICQQNGFIQARIVLEWDYIVTPQFARFCVPLKVTFPLKQRHNGRLLVRATSGMSTEIAYLEPQILDRINQYFGYQAIGKIQIFQGPVSQNLSSRKPQPQPLSDEVRSSLEAQVGEVEDERLRAALLLLGSGIARKETKA